MSTLASQPHSFTDPFFSHQHQLFPQQHSKIGPHTPASLATAPPGSVQAAITNISSNLFDSNSSNNNTASSGISSSPASSAKTTAAPTSTTSYLPSSVHENSLATHAQHMAQTSTNNPPSSQQPLAPGFAAWENPNGSARPHTADAMFGQGNGSNDTAGLHPTSANGLTTNGSYGAPVRPPLLSAYSSGSGGRMFAYMPTSNSDEFASPGYGSFDASYSPYQAPDTASSSTFTSTIQSTPSSTNPKHRSSSASAGTGDEGGTASSTTTVSISTSSSAASLAAAQKKRPRRRYDEIERMYPCNWPGCTKSYGTLNHLNAHVAMQKHGTKRLPTEFKEMRKQWRKAKREDDNRREVARLVASAPHGAPAGAGLAHGMGMGASGHAQFHPPGSAGGLTTDAHYRDNRMDSFSSAPGGYAGDIHGAYGAQSSFYPAAANSYGRHSTSSTFQYAAPHAGSAAVGAGQWMPPSGAPAGPPATAAGLSGSTTAHSMCPPPPVGPGRSYSMSAAGATALAGPPGLPVSTGGWVGHTYATAPPPTFGGGGSGADTSGYAVTTHQNQGYAESASFGHGGNGDGGGGGGGHGAGVYGGMSAPATSAGPANGQMGENSGMHSSSAGFYGDAGSTSGGQTSMAPSSANAAAHVGGLGAYLMAHRGSI